MDSVKVRQGLEYLAIGATIIGGLITAFNYFESRRQKDLQEVNLALEKQIKELQLLQLKNKKA